MKVVKSTPNFQIFWHDPEQTILIFELRADWTWDDVYKGTELMNEALLQQSQCNPVYGVGRIALGAREFPKEGNAIYHIVQLLRQDPSPDELSIFVIRFGLLMNLIHMGMELYKNIVTAHKYVFVQSMEEALKIINEHKTKKHQL